MFEVGTTGFSRMVLCRTFVVKLAIDDFEWSIQIDWFIVSDLTVKVLKLFRLMCTVITFVYNTLRKKHSAFVVCSLKYKRMTVVIRFHVR